MGVIKLNIFRPNANNARYERSPFLSLILQLFSLVLFILCAVLVSLGLWLCYKRGFIAFYIYLAILVTVKITYTEWAKEAWILAKRYAAVDASMVLAKDSRAPILYLRSFLDQFTSDDLWFHVEADEELIYPVVKQIGPVIAIGQPGELLPPTGASRLYVEAQSDWHNAVKEYMEQSQLIIISPRDTKGVIWEISTAYNLSHPEKVLLSLIDFQPSYAKYFKGDDAYQRFRNLVHREVPIPLPENIDKAIFLAFDKDWRPRLLQSTGFVAGFSNRLAVWDVIQRHLRSRGIELTGLFPLKEALLTYCRIILLLILFIFPFVLMILGTLDH